MSQELWTSVDTYLGEVLVRQDQHLSDAVAASDAAGLPSIQVSPPQGKLLEIMIEMMGAKTILEVGTLGGYSTIWMARSLPADGRVVTIEIDPKHAQVAQENFNRAGLGDKIELRTGNARDILPVMIDEGAGPFDFAFIDADKASNPDYFGWALDMSRPGSVIIVDNVIRDGHIIDADSDDASVKGVRRLNEVMAGNPRISVTALQTVGVKGYDGFSVAIVR
ncbi:MAG: O-methyltransferase [Gemmatimonadales bacterium]